MGHDLQSVIDAALHLDRPSQLLLAERLLSESAPESGYTEAWTSEIHRRIEDIRLGRVQTYDAFEVIRETKEQFGL
jgi:hypothetical protein